VIKISSFIPTSMKPAIVASNPGTGEPEVARAVPTVGAMAAFEKSAGAPFARRWPANLPTHADSWLEQQEDRPS